MALDKGNVPTGHGAETDADRGAASVAAILLLAVLAALGLRTILSLDALAPAVASLMFGLAAAVGCVALLLRRSARLLDLAGILTFVGIIVSLTIESDQMTRLMMLSDQPKSN